MGSCMSNQRQKSPQQSFKKDVSLLDKKQVYEPLFTTLFNSMRKISDTVIIFTDPTKAIQFNTTSFDQLKQMPIKSKRTLYSFKKLIIIGNWNQLQNSISQLINSIPISVVYIFTQKMFEKFQQTFPIYFTSKSLSLQAPKIPILAFNSEQLLNTPSKQFYIFIHLIDQKTPEIYDLLKLNQSQCIQPPSVEYSSDQKLKQIKYYVDKLKQKLISQQKVVLLHKKSLGQNMLMQILVKYLIEFHTVEQLSAKNYLVRSLPNAGFGNSDRPITAQLIQGQSNINSTLQLKIQSSQEQKHKHSTMNLIKTTQPKNATQIFHNLFKGHCVETSRQKTERAYNLLSKLITNIISNPSLSIEQNNYRKVKGANKQMEQLLTRNKSGMKLLRQLGFTESDGYWINKLEAKYLKVLRTDMDLGHKNYILEFQQPE